MFLVWSKYDCPATGIFYVARRGCESGGHNFSSSFSAFHVGNQNLLILIRRASNLRVSSPTTTMSGTRVVSYYWPTGRRLYNAWCLNAARLAQTTSLTPVLPLFHPRYLYKVQAMIKHQGSCPRPYFLPLPVRWMHKV